MLLLIAVWVVLSAYVAFVVGNVIAIAVYGLPTIGIDWPWWKAAQFTVYVFVALQLIAALILTT